MTCLVFGASGQIGQYLLPDLCRSDRPVVAVSRVPRPAQNGVAWMRGGLPDAMSTWPDDVRAVVCLGPLDHFTRWLEGADLAGSPRIVAMSSMSAQSKRHSPDSSERALSERLRDAEQRLLQRCAVLGSACTIVRATLIYGGASGSLEKLAARAQRWHVFPLLRGRGLRQPVHAGDLALAVLAALDRPQAVGVIAMGGGERLSASAMFARARRQLAPGTVGVPVPVWACGLLSTITRRGQGMAARLDQDLVADNTKLINSLGVQPRSFEPGLAHGTG